MSYAEIKKEHVTATGGKPELYVDGKKTVPLWYALSTFPTARPWNQCSQEGIKNFSDCGIDIVCVCTNLHEGWQENGEYNPETLYRDIFEVLAANPNAKIVTRLQVSPPYWWLRKYPEEIVKFFREKEIDGKTQYVEVQNTDRGTYGDYIFDRRVPVEELKASMASEKFLHDCGEMLKQLCEKVKEHPLGKHLIGIQVAYGACGEWHYWGANVRTDYSKPMQKLFRKIVRERYQTEEELKRFYGEGATFDNVTLATPEERAATYGKICMSPEKHARVIDSMRTFSVASVEAIRYLCKKIKENWKEILAGSFYGYFFHAESAGAAHCEPHRLFADENVDFLAGPCAYTLNKVAGNANMLRHVAESCRLNGKLFLCEMDQGFASNTGGGIATKAEPYVCESEEEYAAILKRNIMENILLGNGAWYFDHRVTANDCLKEKEGYWNTPERLKTIAEMQKACEKLLDKPYKKTTDVLLVVDTERLYYKWLNSAKFDFIQALLKSGAGVDRLYLSDIEKCDISRYKCVIFLDCRAMAQKTYDYIRNTVMSDGRTVVLANDFAEVIEKTTNENRIAEIIGENRGESYKEYEKENCRICVMPETVTEREFYYDLFQRAGAHIYADNGEVIIADNEMVMMHCKGIPTTTLHLHCGDVEVDNGKYNTVVYNTFTGEQIL